MYICGKYRSCNEYLSFGSPGFCHSDCRTGSTSTGVLAAKVSPREVGRRLVSHLHRLELRSSKNTPLGQDGVRHQKTAGMNHIFNEDFQDFIRALNECRVEYILVGGYAVILHGYSRTTGDMDIWVKPDEENYSRLVNAFHKFGMPVFDMTLERFLLIPYYDVFTFGRPPVSIDIITHIKGLDFEEAFLAARWFDIEEDLSVRGLSLQSLLTAKRASARNKDLDDIEHLSE